MSAFLFYFALLIARTGGQSAVTQQPQLPEQHSVPPRLTLSEVSELQAKAEKGDLIAQYALGKAYEGGKGITENDELAVKWYRKAAEQGNSDAQTRLGIMYRLGLGVPRDKEEAVRWYRKAAKQGNAQGMFNMGVSYYNGDGVPSDPTAAYAWFLLAQEAGNPLAEDAVKRSSEEGGRLGPPDAFQKVAAMYEKGDEVPQNSGEAVKWYRKAADLSPQAAFKLAAMLIDGKGVPQDYAQAMKLCQMAAKQNYVPAQFCVGYIYQHGLGVGTDLKQAAKSYEEASIRGYSPAMMALGEMYWKGAGKSMDRAEAYYYFFFAAQGKGAPGARTQAQTLWKEMTKDDIKHLEKKLRGAHLDPQKVFASMQDQTTPEAAAGLSQP